MGYIGQSYDAAPASELDRDETKTAHVRLCPGMLRERAGVEERHDVGTPDDWPPISSGSSGSHHEPSASGCSMDAVSSWLLACLIEGL